MNPFVKLAWLLTTAFIGYGTGGEVSCRSDVSACRLTSQGTNFTSFHLLSPRKPQTTRETDAMSSLTTFLLQHTLHRDVFIIHDYTLPGLVGMIESCFQSFVDTTTFTYDLATLKYVTSPPDLTSNMRFFVLLCSYNNTMEIFNEVRRMSLESRQVRWVVLGEGERMRLSLPMVLREGTHVGLILRMDANIFHIFSSYVDQNNSVRFRKVGEWDMDGSLGYPQHQPIFPNLAVSYRDFQGRHLMVTTVNNFPFFTLIYRDDLPPLPDRGIDANIVLALSTFLNFTFTVVEPADRKWGGPQPDGTVTGMIGEVAGHRAHLAINEITVTVQRETVVDFTQPYFLESTTLVSRAPSELPRSLAVFYPFSIYLWFLLMVVILLMGLLVFLVSRLHDLTTTRDLTAASATEESHQESGSESLVNKDSLKNVSATCFNVFRTIVLQGNLLPARSWPIRMVLFSWFAFCVILYALYGGTLTAYMTKPSYEAPIDSLVDAVEAHHKYGFVPVAQLGTSNLRLWKNAKQGILKALYDLTDPSRGFPRSGNEAFKRVLSEKVVYMTPRLNSEVRATQRGRHHFHIARNTFLYQGYGVACRIGSPFVSVFDTMILRMVQGGLVDKWVKDEVAELRVRTGSGGGGGGGGEGKVESRALSLDHLQGAFYILLSGGVLAAVVFLVESLRRPKTI